MKKYLFVITTVTAILLLAACSQKNDKVERKFYNSWEAQIGYAQVTKAGSMLYISGLTSTKEGMNEQVKEIYTTISKILNDYGVDTSYIVKETAYTKDIEALKDAIYVRKEFFTDIQYPAATWVQIDRLFNEAMLVEIEVIAWVPDK